MDLPVLPPSPLPPRYDAWMRECLPGPVAPEQAATCGDCAMCASDSDDRSRQYFNPNVKCCSYLPELPNFIVGGILADRDPAAARGRQSVEQRIDARGISVTPLGLKQPPLYRTLYGPVPFGESETLRCPHFLPDAQYQCGIWRHREAVCTTWFCKHDHGRRGAEFWSSLKQVLRDAEQSLTHWCVLQLELGNEALAALFPTEPVAAAASDYDNKPNPDYQRRVWGRWAGREREFYVQAHRLVEPLGWPQILAIGGARLRLAGELMRLAYQRMVSGEIPQRLRQGDVQLKADGPDHFLALSYSPSDPLRLPAELVGVLPYFDGGSTQAALKKIARKRGLRLTPGLVKRLVDFGILEPPPV
jgi:hypothetical protein